MSENESREGERENERKEERGRGGCICADTTPHGALCDCVKGVHARHCGKERLSMCEFVNMGERKKREQGKGFYMRLFLYMAFKRERSEAGYSWGHSLGLQAPPPTRAHTHSHGHLFSGGDGFTSKLCLNLPIQTAVCCFNVIFMAIKVKSRMSVHVI